MKYNCAQSIFFLKREELFLIQRVLEQNIPITLQVIRNQEFIV